jgi:hypothetical protein
MRYLICCSEVGIQAGTRGGSRSGDLRCGQQQSPTIENLLVVVRDRYSVSEVVTDFHWSW